jgi:hypothetical protein
MLANCNEVHMSRTRLIRLFAASVVTVIALGCADYTTSPTDAIQAPSTIVAYRGLAGGAVVHGVRWSGDRGALHQTSGVIGPDGGTLSIPEADFTIVFPRGALRSSTNITIVPNADGYVGYEMLPHGLIFGQPVTVTQGLDHSSRSQGVFCAYLALGSGIGANGSANALEIETSITNYAAGSGRLRAVSQTWKLNHFSRYILGTGATDSTGTGSGQ